MENHLNTKSVSSKSRNLFTFLLTGKKLPLIIFILATILTLPSVNSGIFMDDFHMKAVMLNPDNPHNFMDSPFDIFNFFDGDQKKLNEMMDYGFLPWWFTNTQIKASFWRPLTAFTHWLDYILFEGNPKIMHLHSILWYAVLASLVCLYYRKIMGPVVAAGLAGLMWVFDETHGTPVGFISNRNTLIACVFCIITLIAHDKWYKQRNTKWLFIAIASLAASLFSKEAGIATVAYIFAYIVFLESNTWKNKFLRFTPYIIVVVIWRAIWTGLGYGVKNVGLYIDPLNEPMRFLSEMPGKMVILLSSQLAGIHSDIFVLLSTSSVTKLILLDTVILVVLTIIIWPLLKTNKTSRFWACGMLLSTIPCCSAFVSDRMLMFVGIGAMGLMGQFFTFVFNNKDIYKSKRTLKTISIGVVTFIVFCNIIFSPLGLLAKSAYPIGPPSLINKVYIPPIEDPEITNQDLILVNPPSTFVSMCSPYLMDPEYKNKPKRFKMLCSSMFGPTEVTRLDEYSILIKPTRSFAPSIMERLFDNKIHAEIGTVYKRNNMQVEVTEITDDFIPTAAIFRFDQTLESPCYRWIRWNYGYYEPYKLPEIGQTQTLHGGTIKGAIDHLLKRDK